MVSYASATKHRASPALRILYFSTRAIATLCFPSSLARLYFPSAFTALVSSERLQVPMLFTHNRRYVSVQQSRTFARPCVYSIVASTTTCVFTSACTRLASTLRYLALFTLAELALVFSASLRHFRAWQFLRNLQR